MRRDSGWLIDDDSGFLTCSKATFDCARVGFREGFFFSGYARRGPDQLTALAATCADVKPRRLTAWTILMRVASRWAGLALLVVSDPFAATA